MGLPASAFQPPGPKPQGMDLVLLSLSYFNRDRPAPALILRTETRSGAGMKLTPARWAQNQEPSPTTKIWSKALQLRHLHGHSEQRIMSTFAQSS